MFQFENDALHVVSALSACYAKITKSALFLNFLDFNTRHNHTAIKGEKNHLTHSPITDKVNLQQKP